MITLFDLLLPEERWALELEVRSYLPPRPHPQSVQHLLDMGAACVHRARGAEMIAAAMRGER